MRWKVEGERGKAVSHSTFYVPPVKVQGGMPFFVPRFTFHQNYFERAKLLQIR